MLEAQVFLDFCAVKHEMLLDNFWSHLWSLLIFDELWLPLDVNIMSSNNYFYWAKSFQVQLFINKTVVF